MEEVRRLRQAKGWNQNELAFHADLAPSVISLLETGKREPNATTLRKLAEALEVRIPDLFEDSGSGKAPRRSPPEPSLFNGLEDERRFSLFTETVTALADRWYAAVADPELPTRVVLGLVDAALDLSKVIGDRADAIYEALPVEERHAVMRAWQVVIETADRGLERFKDEENAAEFRRRREKIRERTREISRWSKSA